MIHNLNGKGIISILLIGIMVFSMYWFATDNPILTTKEKTEETWEEAYQSLILEEGFKKMALIYLDEDSIPELLVIKNGSYRLYTFDGVQAAAIDMSDLEIRAKAYTLRHKVEYFPRYLTFSWFEYVPYQGLIRVHNNNGQSWERCDYYLKYESGALTLELKAEYNNSYWYTCNQQEITNEEFLSSLSDLGYEQLIPCGFLYDNIEEAYANIGRTVNSRAALEGFVSGKTNAVYYVKGVTDIPEYDFFMKSYEDIYNAIVPKGAFGSTEYVDFDNDGEEELIIQSDTGACVFFDVIGDTVYRVMRIFDDTSGTTYIAERNGKRVIVTRDQLRGTKGLKSYVVRQYDSCGCLVDYFWLSASYEGADYSMTDEFEYRDQPVTVEKFDEIEHSMRQVWPKTVDSYGDG